MNEQAKLGGNLSRQDNGAQPIIIQHAHPARGWVMRLLLIGLIVSIGFNISMYVKYQDYFTDADDPIERYHSGQSIAHPKIAVIRMSGTIMPPFTSRILNAIERAKDDDRVKGVVLVIDSPGGLVADSHEIYHRLVELRKEKPIAVSMKRIAASGGYYIAMGAGEDGRIFAEPTTWTGSIGVIIPRYDVSKLAEKFGVESEPLKTGPFKDALSPFRELSVDEREIWEGILQDAYDRFLNVIAQNRKDLDYERVKELATGRIYTADDAVKNHLVDAIGYEEDAIEHLKSQLDLEQVRVVKYEFRPNLIDFFLGAAEARQPEHQWQRMIEATVPQAMYLFSGMPGLTAAKIWTEF